MSNILHLAIEAGDLNVTVPFYCDILGCKSGNQEQGKWIDIDFWGNELTLHQSSTRSAGMRHKVDMGEVVVPHFGVHMPNDEFQALKARLVEKGVCYLDEPYRRFKDTELEQETFFVEDPNGNVLEMKTMVNPDLLFEVKL